MTEARRDFRPSAGVLCALAAIAAASVCSCSSDTSDQPRGTGSNAASSSGAAGAGSGGADGTGGAAPYTLTRLATALAFDATPDPQASTVYFTGIDANGGSGVFKTAAHGNASITPLAAGPPFAAPLGIATSTDGTRLYVADPGASDASGIDTGQIFWVDITTRRSGPVAGGEGTLARSLEVTRSRAGGDLLTFSGIDKGDGRPGVFQLSAQGGSVSVLAKGRPFVDPSGLTVASDGRVFVCDTLANPDKTATLFAIEDGFVATLFTGLHAGYPCGLALTLEEQMIFVGARNTETGKDEIMGIDIASATVVMRSEGIDSRDEPGGLHRAKGADVFAFIEGGDQNTGAVLLLKR